MGIKNLHTFLKKHLKKEGLYFDVYEEISLNEFKGKTVAVDISIFLYKYKCIMADKWLNSIHTLIKCFQKYGIKMIVVFDGATLPAKKMEFEKRREQKKKMTKKINDLELALKLYKKSGEIKQELLDIQKKYQSKLQQLLKPTEQSIDTEFIESIIQKKKCQNVRITKKDICILKELLTIYSIPFHVAKYEAEALCSSLCIIGKVDAVLSEDTDILAYGTPVFLYKLNTLRGTCHILELNKLLKALNMTKEQFRDFCIMCGTDYNTNVSKVGPVNSFKLLIEHKNIEAVIDVLNGKKKDTSVLKHELCKTIFENNQQKEGKSINANFKNIYSKDFDKYHVFKFKHNLY